MTTTAAPRMPPTTATARPSAAGRFALFPVRAFLAFGWLRAGVEKVIDPEWWSGAEINRFVADQEAAMLPFMSPVVDIVVRPAPAAVAAIVVTVELALGALLLTGRRLLPALVTASGLNVVFVLMGVVTPSAFYLVMQASLILWLLGRDPSWTSRHRLALAAAAGAGGFAALPFVETLHPAEVIHDPAIMLATVASLVTASQLFEVVGERLRGVPGR